MCEECTVYVIISIINGKKYVGHTKNLQRRLNEHNQGINCYTSGKGPWEVIYTETYKTRSEAVKRERFLKSGRGREFLRKTLNV